jgi:signal transduction histidine kinase
VAAPLFTEPARECKLADSLADRLRRSRFEIADRWIQEITASRVDRPRPSRVMTDAMPLLIDGIAWYLEHPRDAIGSDTPVVGTAMQLCMHRYAQGFDAHEILEEYVLLGRVLFDALTTSVENAALPCHRSELLVCGYRLFHALARIETATSLHFIRLSREEVAEREGRLQAFNRAVSYEIKNRIGTVINAGEMLRTAADLSHPQLERFARIITTNAQEMRVTVDNLLVLARLEDVPREQRHMNLAAMVADVTKQVRTLAEAAQVNVQVADGVPDVDVNAAVHLVLANYVTNAIKYCDPGESSRHVYIDAAIEPGASGGQELVVRVKDNGIGVPDEKREALFQRFFRAHDKRQTQGTGLGLAIVRETIAAIGGRAWADFPGKGSVFSFAVPFRPRSASSPPPRAPQPAP